MSVVVRQLIDALPEVAVSAQSGPTGVFLLAPLLEMWQKTLGWNGVCVSSGRLILVGFEKPTAVGRIFFSMPYGGYGGVLGEGTGDDFAAIAAWLRGTGYLQENIVQFQSSQSAAYPESYYRNILATHIIELTASAGEYSENTKRNIKKSQEQGLQVARLGMSDSAAYLDILLSHQKRTGEIRRMPQKCYSFLLGLSDQSNSGISVFAATGKSGLQCVHIYFATATDAFYFDGFSTQDGLDAGANFLLLETMIENYRHSGVQRLNLGATPPLDKGLKRFKEGWGAAEVDYTEYVRRSQLKRFIDFMTRVR